MKKLVVLGPSLSSGPAELARELEPVAGAAVPTSAAAASPVSVVSAVPSKPLEPEAALPLPRPAPRRLALSAAERKAVTALLSTNRAQVEAFVAERATAYATGDAGVRVRALSRAAAVQEAIAQQLVAVLAEAIPRRDPAIPVLNRALDSATARHLDYLEQLRVETAPSRRIVMSAQGRITVSAEET